MIRELNSYEVISTSSTKKTVVATDIKAAVNALVDTLDPIVSARLTARNLSVDVPDANVRFQTAVLDAAAEAAGCKAYPLVHEVEANKEVIFTAVPVDGYQFVNWSRGAVVLSTDAEAVIAVTPLTGDEVIATITANFIVI
jgi:hypothetical protein